MGVAKVFSFFLGTGLTLLISGATLLLVWMAYRRWKGKGILWLLAAVAMQFVGTILARIVFSPVTVVDYPLRDALRVIAFYIPVIASIVALVGWFFLSRKKHSAGPAATAQRGQPSVFGRFTRIRNSVLARPAWLI